MLALARHYAPLPARTRDRGDDKHILAEFRRARRELRRLALLDPEALIRALRLEQADLEIDDLRAVRRWVDAVERALNGS
jgi:hypothetical protein